MRAVVDSTIIAALLKGKITFLAVRPLHLPHLDTAQVERVLTNDPLIAPSASAAEETAFVNGDAHTAMWIN